MYIEKCDKIIVFNPIRTNIEFLRLLVKENLEFVVYFTHPIESISKYLLNKLEKDFFVKYFFYNKNTFYFNSNDLLVPCDDESAKLVDELCSNNLNKFSDNKNLLEIRTNKKKYLNYIDNKIIENIEFPCVIKPIESAGGANTFIIKTLEDYLSIKDKINLKKSIIQKYFFGTEYSVDVISKNGNHYLIGIWKYYKKDNTTLREKIEFVNNLESNLINIIFSFVKKCLDKVGKLNGATHTEVIVNNENICSLVEINFRFHGHSIHEHYLKCSNESHFSAYIKKIIKNEFIPEIYQSKNYAIKVLINLKQKLKLSKIDWDFIKNLKSVVRVIEHPPLNDNEYGPTTDVRSCLCYIMMYDNQTTYKDDLEKIKLWEKKIYEIAS